MRRYARHYQTGEPIPEEPLRRLLAARNFNQGFATVEYTGSALLDLELHRDPAPEALDVARFEREFIDRIGMPQDRPAGTARPIFSTCLPAAVMPLAITPICGRKCWTPTVLPPLPRPAMFSIRRSRNASKIIYSAGDTRDPMELYRAFRGREPTIEALLEQRGLTAA